jgi:chlorosome envelope protein F
MANENNGIFSDLFSAVGAPIQNVADLVGDGVNAAVSIAQSGVDLCGTIVTSSVNTATQIIQGVATGISSAITPKK